ncbi:aminopeptidase [Prolixibacteraceae bacterium JC049]|nr:aminopeptidase [Prolixibacteraceae bacterium JC049]
MGGISLGANAQDFEIKKENKVEVTPVKNQYRTGTCWSFATTSFIESELLRMGKGTFDLSEMYFVRYAYLNKAKRYMRYHGVANFSQGGQAHDVMNVLRDYGMVTNESYTGLNYGTTKHDHYSEMEPMLKGALDGIAKGKVKRLTPTWELGFAGILDAYLGKAPSKITVNNKEVTPVEFAKEMGINANDYIEITSYEAYPFYEKVNLEVPDNWSDDLYYNLPAEDMMKVMNYALENGYSICWDGDVSERQFSHKSGYAKLQMSLEGKNIDKVRQDTFDDWTSTDDHLMHVVGTSYDKDGNKYFITKNSWGEKSNSFGGYLHMSDDYVKIKTVAFMIHKDALPKDIAKKLFKKN